MHHRASAVTLGCDNASQSVGNTHDQHNQCVVLQFVDHSKVADAKATQPRAALPSAHLPRYGFSFSRSIAATIHKRSGLAIRRNSLAALPLIRIEKLTPDPIPVQHRIVRITKPFDRYREIVESSIEIALDGLGE